MTLCLFVCIHIDFNCVETEILEQIQSLIRETLLLHTFSSL